MILPQRAANRAAEPRAAAAEETIARCCVDMTDDASTDDELAQELGGMRVADDPTDQLARSVVKARIANALFSSGRRVDLGRYQLLDRAGSGGMGVVWSAWDPELERRVAIKFVRPTIRSAREQILREGQALAKLSHPNIVPIFDVGVLDDQVYLVMEWVRGTTLREFTPGKYSTKAIVAVYRQACAGLAAAHHAGVIHRDFKPENAICGDDGRVRVLDFGLAALRATDAATRGAVGTPRYMAPEQAAGSTVTAAADQYAFCTSLREALAGHGFRSIPHWLDEILVRGTASEPSARFATMTALAAALDRDPAKRWRRIGLTAVVLAGAGLAFAIGRSRSEVSAESRCTGVADVSATWNVSRRRAMTEHLRSLGEFGAHEADRLADELAAYAASWGAARTHACVAYNRGQLPPVLYEQRLRCLGRSQAALTAAIELASEVTADRLASALIAARSLPSTSGCSAEDMVAVAPPPQAIAATVAEIAAAVERARMLTLAASPRAIDAATRAADAALATGYVPLIARATLMQGWSVSPTDRSAGWTLLDRAFHAAVRAGDDVLAVEAYARAWFVASRAADFTPRRDERALVEDLAARTGAPGRFSRALLYNNFGTERIVANDRTAARDLLRQALNIWNPPLGNRSHDIELGVILGNLALVEDQPARRVELSQRAVDLQVAQLGPDHPATVNAKIQLALLTTDPVAAARSLAQTCDAIPEWHGRLRIECAYEEGWLAIDRGDRPRAQRAMTAARANSNDRLRNTIAKAYLDVVSTDRARIGAARDTMRDLALELSTDHGWWNKALAADAWVIAALAETALDRAEPAVRAWQRALDELSDQPVLERRRARAHATLAFLLERSQPAKARSHAAAAIAWYRTARGYESEIAPLQRLIDAT